jgi:hypothetical protein
MSDEKKYQVASSDCFVMAWDGIHDNKTGLRLYGEDPEWSDKMKRVYLQMRAVGPVVITLRGLFACGENDQTIYQHFYISVQYETREHCCEHFGDDIRDQFTLFVNAVAKEHAGLWRYVSNDVNGTLVGYDTQCAPHLILLEDGTWALQYPRQYGRHHLDWWSWDAHQMRHLLVQA